LTGRDDENEVLIQNDLNKLRQKVIEEVKPGYPPVSALHFTKLKPGDHGFKEDPPVVYNEEEIFKRPVRKIIVRK
jgi:hypothetical protein